MELITKHSKTDIKQILKRAVEEAKADDSEFVMETKCERNTDHLTLSYSIKIEFYEYGELVKTLVWKESHSNAMSLTNSDREKLLKLTAELGEWVHKNFRCSLGTFLSHTVFIYE